MISFCQHDTPSEISADQLVNWLVEPSSFFYDRSSSADSRFNDTIQALRFNDSMMIVKIQQLKFLSHLKNTLPNCSHGKLQQLRDVGARGLIKIDDNFLGARATLINRAQQPTMASLHLRMRPNEEECHFRSTPNLTSKGCNLVLKE